MTSGDRDSSVGSGDRVFPLEAVENIAAEEDSCGGGDATVAALAGDDDVDG